MHELRLHAKGEVAKLLGNQARGVQPACTMIKQNSALKVDNLFSNLLLENLIGQFKPVIVCE